MRTLLAQIYEAGQFHDNAVTQKTGLRRALEAVGPLHDFDYLANDRATLFQGFVNRIDTFHPDLVLTQFHGADPDILAGVRMLRERYPGVVFCNWSGDSWSWSLTSNSILELAALYDLWLVAAPDVLPIYAERGIRAAYWQIGMEIPDPPLPDMPTYDVVFMGNIISEQRRALRTFLRTLPCSVGIYGDGDDVDGHNTYDFAAGASLYRNAKLAIADAAYVDQRNYVSNRPLQIMGAGGALLLHQHVPKMKDLLGIDGGVHYIEWETFDHLRRLIDRYLKPDFDPLRRAIAAQAQEYVYEHHTYTRRVEQLLELVGNLK
jgi:hypothetical protein